MQTFLSERFDTHLGSADLSSYTYTDMKISMEHRSTTEQLRAY